MIDEVVETRPDRDEDATRGFRRACQARAFN